MWPQYKSLLYYTSAGFKKLEATQIIWLGWRRITVKGFFNQRTVGIFPDPQKATNSVKKREKWEVRLDNTYTSLYSQKEGVRQENILSPYLFTIKVNSIVKFSQAGIKTSLYPTTWLLLNRPASLLGMVMLLVKIALNVYPRKRLAYITLTKVDYTLSLILIISIWETTPYWIRCQIPQCFCFEE